MFKFSNNFNHNFREIIGLGGGGEIKTGIFQMQLLTENKLHKVGAGFKYKYVPQRHIRSLAQTVAMAQSVLSLTSFS